jgi:hypothetical protein
MEKRGADRHRQHDERHRDLIGAREALPAINRQRDRPERDQPTKRETGGAAGDGVAGKRDDGGESQEQSRRRMKEAQDRRRGRHHADTGEADREHEEPQRVDRRRRWRRESGIDGSEGPVEDLRDRRRHVRERERESEARREIDPHPQRSDIAALHAGLGRDDTEQCTARDRVDDDERRA